MTEGEKYFLNKKNSQKVERCKSRESVWLDALYLVGVDQSEKRELDDLWIIKGHRIQNYGGNDIVRDIRQKGPFWAFLLITRWLTEAVERRVHRRVGWAGGWSCSRTEHWNIFQIIFSLLLEMYQLRSYREVKVLDVLNHLRNKSWNIFIIKRFSNAGTF